VPPTSNDWREWVVVILACLRTYIQDQMEWLRAGKQLWHHLLCECTTDYTNCSYPGCQNARAVLRHRVACQVCWQCVLYLCVCAPCACLYSSCKKQSLLTSLKACWKMQWFISMNIVRSSPIMVWLIDVINSSCGAHHTWINLTVIWWSALNYHRAINVWTVCKILEGRLCFKIWGTLHA